jgi:hypothetical protein
LIIILAGPVSLPLLGDLPSIAKHGFHNYLLLCQEKYGKIFKVSSMMWV